MTVINAAQWMGIAGLVLATQPGWGQPAARVAPSATPVKVSEAQGAQVIGVSKFFFKPSNENIGVRMRGMFCSSPEDLKYTDTLGRIVMAKAVDVTWRELRASGYPAPVESAFAAVTGEASIEYQLAATLVDIEINYCGEGFDVTGSAWARLDWELYSPRERRVVYRASHEGSVAPAAKETTTLALLFERAVAGSARSLFADPKFVEHATRRAVALGKDAQASRLAIAVRQQGTPRAQEQMPQLQSAVATIFSGPSNGSAFVVSADGYLLTNQHVVGDAKFVKVKLANGRELLGEVVRLDRVRDVALIKTDAVALVPMAIAAIQPQAGDEVFAIGSPLSESLAGTVTRGVLSGVREVEQQRWLQSDVRVLPGSSGGPLVSASGAVVGIASRGVSGGLAGINFFVPINDAMAALAVDFRAP